MRGYKGNPDLTVTRSGKISLKEYYEMIHAENAEPTSETQIERSRIIASAGSLMYQFPEYPY